MNTYRFPWDIPVDQLAWKLDKKMAKNDPTQADGVRTQTLSNGRWRSTFSLPNNLYLDGNRLHNFLLSIDGVANRFKMPDFSRMYPRGGLKTLAGWQELCTNSDFTQGITGWTFNTAHAQSRVSATYDARLMSDGVHNPNIYQQITVTPGSIYCVRMFVELVSSVNVNLQVGTALGLSDLGSVSAGSHDGYVELQFNSGLNTSVYVQAHGSADTSGCYSNINLISCQRVLTINGAGQATNILKLTSGPSNTTGVLLSGDLIECASHIYELLSDLDTDNTGSGTVKVAPLVKSPANGASVIAQIPTCIMLWNTDLTWSTKAPIFVGITGEAVEDTLS